MYISYMYVCLCTYVHVHLCKYMHNSRTLNRFHRIRTLTPRIQGGEDVYIIYTCIYVHMHMYTFIYIYIYIHTNICILTDTRWRRPTGGLILTGHLKKTHRMPSLYRSFSAKEPYNYWLFCGT